MHEDPLERLKSSWQKNEDCPSSEELTAFHEKSLEAEAMNKISNHVARCGMCDLAVTSLKDFDNSGTQTEHKGLRFIFHSAWKPAFAFLLALALLYPAYLGVSRKLEPPRPTPQYEPTQVPENAAGSATVFDLGEAGSKRGPKTPRVHEIALKPKQAYIILNFYLPVRRDHSYKMEIQRADRNMVLASHEIEAGDAIGNFSIVVSRSLLADGDYRMLISESEKSSNQPIDRYEFLLRIKSPLQ